MIKNTHQISFNHICDRKILDFLIGDKSIPNKSETNRSSTNKELKLPYLKGYEIDELFNKFDLLTPNDSEYRSSSRWARMQNLIIELDKLGKADQLLIYLFSKKNLSSSTNDISNREDLKKRISDICKYGIEYINTVLFKQDKELVLRNDLCYIQNIGNELVIKPEITNKTDRVYISNLLNQIKEQVKQNDYESVITKCRTLIEEVLIYIINENGETHSEKGNINKLLQQCKTLLNLNQSSEYDNYTNGILGGLEKIIINIANLRNQNSDAHGVGKKRIRIKKNEVNLVINATITYCDYIISILNYPIETQPIEELGKYSSH